MLSLLVSVLILAHVCTAARTHWFAFGDSYTTTGFLYKNEQPSDVNPIGNPPLPGETACGKRPNWVYYNALKYNASQIYVYDFGYGGATIDRKVIPPANPQIRTFGDQIEAFAAGYTGKAPVHKLAWNGSEAVFSVFFGINDIGLGSYKNAANQSALHTRLMDSYMAGLRRLFALGARNIMILNVPPTDRSPLITGRGAQDMQKYKAAVADYNKKLKNRVIIFMKNHPKAVVRLVDVNSAIQKLVNNPKKFGFRDATTFGTANDVLWCNNYHISPAAHNYLAKAVQAKVGSTKAFHAFKP